MKSINILAVAGLLAIAMPLAAQAKGGASGFSPGHSFHTSGPVAGTHGASGYAPGQLMQKNGPVTGTNGASGYAPGHTK